MIREAVKKEEEYFTVRLTVRVDPPPLYGQFFVIFFSRGAFDLGLGTLPPKKTGKCGNFSQMGDPPPLPPVWE